MSQIDHRKLASLLTSIGWTLPKMEATVGHRLDGSATVTAETKRLVWAIISDAEIRRKIEEVRLAFPKAIVDAIR